MSNINLLPWREARASQRKQEFILIIVLCIMFTIVVSFSVNWIVKINITTQQQRNERLVQEIATLDAQLGEITKLKERRNELIDRMKLIEQLQQRRNLPVRLLNQLPELVPNGVYLNTLVLQNNGIEMDGKTESYGRIASMMRRIDGSGWLGPSKITTIYSAEAKVISLNEFFITFMIKNSSSIKDPVKEGA